MFAPATAKPKASPAAGKAHPDKSRPTPAKKSPRQLERSQPTTRVPSTPAPSLLSIPPTPRLGSTQDRFEHEAGRIADEVVTSPSSTPLPLSRGSSVSGFPLAPTNSVSASTPSIQQVIDSPAIALDSATRSLMEPHFGQSFSHVRVHANPLAARSAHDLHADAYTLGNDIVFAANRFNPSSRSGRHLLAHELAHVAQQGGRAQAIQRAPASPNPGMTVTHIDPNPGVVVTPLPVVTHIEVFTPTGKPNDADYARSEGDKDAIEIRKQNTLNARLSNILDAKRAYFKGRALVMYQQTIQPALDLLGGGLATVHNVGKELLPILDEWQHAAQLGDNHFATGALNDRVNALDSGSQQSFIAGLIGNTIWAATIFLPEIELLQFTVSLAGILIAAGPTVPKKKTDTLIPDTQKLLDNCIYRFHGELVKFFDKRAGELISQAPWLTQYEAALQIVRESFKPEFFGVTDAGTIVVKEEAITAAYEREAVDRLKRFKAQVSPFLLQKT